MFDELQRAKEEIKKLKKELEKERKNVSLGIFISSLIIQSIKREVLK